MNVKSKILLLIASSAGISISAISPALPKIAEAFNSNDNAEFLVKVMLTIPSLMIAFFAPLTGLIIDKGHRKKLLIGSLITYGLMGTTGLYLNDLLHFIISRALFGLGVAGIMTSIETLIADFYIGEERNKMVALQGACVSLGGVAYIVLAGALTILSWRYPFGLYTLGLLLTIPALYFIKEPSEQKEHGIDHIDTNTTFDRTTFLPVAGIGLIVFIAMVFFYSIPTQLPFLLSIHGITSPAKAGIAVSLVALAGGFTSFTMPYFKKRYHFSALAGRAFVLLTIGFLGLSIAHSFLLTLVFAVFAGSGIGLLMPTMRLWVITIASLPLRGRSVGFITSSLYLGQFLSPIVSQPVVAIHGITILYTIIGCTSIVMALYLLSRTAKVS
ncbi:MAG: MFS transporter [Bacteroidota bacterium]